MELLSVHQGRTKEQEIIMNKHMILVIDLLRKLCRTILFCQQSAFYGTFAKAVTAPLPTEARKKDEKK